MPFKKQSNGKYKSPSGRTFTKKQVGAYYATDGFTEGRAAMAKVAAKMKKK